MRVFIMERSRYPEEGIVIVAARSEGEACRVYGEYENYNNSPVIPSPYRVIEMPNLSCVSLTAKILYSIAR